MEREKMSQAKQKEVPAMKMLKGFTILLSMMFVLGVMKAAQAELTSVLGPVQITSKAKHDDHGKEHHHGDRKKEAKFTFPSVAGGGIVIIKNSGDSKNKGISSAEIKLNGHEIADEDFATGVDTLQYNVDLLPTNELEVEVKSCKECVITVEVKGEKSGSPTPPLPPRSTVPSAPPMF